jgi:hypothetical protein
MHGQPKINQSNNLKTKKTMSLNVYMSSDSDVAPVIQKCLEDVPGGLTLVTSEIPDAITCIKSGTIVEFSEATRLAHVVKTAVKNTTESGTDYKVNKNHLFKVGDYIAKTVGSAAYAITAIDTTNASYDTISVATTLGSLTDLDVLFQSSAAGASAAAYKYTAGGFVKETISFVNPPLWDNKKTNAVITVMQRGTVYENRLPYSATAAIKTALGAGLRFSASF